MFTECTLVHKLTHIQRQMRQDVRMVGARTGHAGCHHVAIADRLDFLHVVFFYQIVKVRKDFVKQIDQLAVGDIFSDIGVKSTTSAKRMLAPSK